MNQQKNLMRTFRCAACGMTLMLGGMLSAAQAAMIPYVNEFDSTGLPNASAQFTLDGANGEFDYSAGGGVVLSTAAESIDIASGTNLVVSTAFTINNLAGSGNLPTLGLGILGSSSTFLTTSGNSYYLADWGISSTIATAGQLRILAQGDTSGFLSASGDSDGANANGSSVVIGDTYELRLTGTYALGTLNMTLAMYDGAGNQLGTAATATDTSPLTGPFFGYRNRTAGLNHNVDVSYDNFSVIPEPALLLSFVIGALGLAAANRRSSRR
jgi:hypothetical protein